MQILKQGTDCILKELSDFSLPEIFDCGQCFTFRRVASAEDDACFSYEGTAKGQSLHLCQKQDGSVVLKNTSLQKLEEIWFDYFDLGSDYTEIKANLSQDQTLKEAITYAPGIRVLRQDSWEALCCFILSQNNHIKRIQGIVERFCEGFGRELSDGIFSFPTAAELRGISIEDLSPLRSGFRAKYLVDAVEKVNSGTVKLSQIPNMPLAQAKTELLQIYGVGTKVADCALLYGFYRLECCPMDVWMKRVISCLYPNGLPECAKAQLGIAQQYLFHYARTHGASRTG